MNKERFVFDLLQAYGLPKTTISRLEKGGMNLSKDDGEIILKKKLYYKFVSDGDVGSDYDTVLADTKVGKYDQSF